MGNTVASTTVEKKNVVGNEPPAFRKVYNGKTLDTQEDVAIFSYNGESFNTLAVQEVIHHVMSVRKTRFKFCPR